MAQKKASKVAETCRFNIDGRCHRYPPIATFSGFEFPMVEDDCYCGESEVKNGTDIVKHP
jgi:hypothetical protein